MYITKKHLRTYIAGWENDMMELGTYTRGKRVYGPVEKDRYLTLFYACYICRDMMAHLKDNEGYIPENVISILKREDWTYHSFSSKVLYGAELDEALMATKKESKDRIALLTMQAYYLEKAASLVADIIEEVE